MSSRTPNPDSPRPLVVCPLRYELRALSRAGLDRRCDLDCCGPGADAITRWAEALGRTRRPIILAGLAGALNPSLRAGSARLVTEVRDHTGKSHLPPLPPSGTPAMPPHGCAITSADDAVCTPADKNRIACETGADLVDLESVAFARSASSLQWSWAVVRGVSDDALTHLPPELRRWVDSRGRARLPRLVTDLLGHPRRLPAVFRLRRHAAAALRAVAMQLDQLIEGLEGR